MSRASIWTIVAVACSAASPGFPAEIGHVALHSGVNEVAISVRNASRRDLSSLSVELPDKLPDWLGLTSTGGVTTLPRGDQAVDAIVLTAVVEGHGVHEAEVIELGLRDALGSRWICAVTLEHAVTREVDPVTGTNADPEDGRRQSLTSCPNPFNPTTVIRYSVPDRQQVSIAIYNVEGQKVRTLVSRVASGGQQAVQWDGVDDRGVPVSSGVYLCRMVTRERVETTRLVLLK